MRVVIDAHSTQGQRTGIGHYTERLIAALREVAPEHTFVPLNSAQERPMQLQRRLWWQQLQVPLRAHRAHPDLLHVPGFDAPLWHVAPTVLTCHDLIGALFPANLPPISRFYWSRWLPFSLRFADAIIADSHATRRDIERLTSIPPARIQVVHLAVDGRFAPQAVEQIMACRERYHLPKRFILYVGTIEPRKGIDTLIDAFARLAPKFPALGLVIAGKKGWYWESILSKITAANLEARIHVTGYVEDGDLPALYSAAQVLAFPSRYEGFGLPLLEGMACELPVVCSTAASLPEICGDAGIQVAPDEPDALAAALESILDSPELASHLRQQGTIRAKQFTWRRTAQNTLDVYTALLAGEYP